MSGDIHAFHSSRDMLRVSLAHGIAGQPAGAGHTRSVPSWPPEARQSHAFDPAVVAFERRADGLPGLGVPQPQRAIEAAGGQDIAKAAVFLASDDAEFITGVEFAVDGGRTV